MASEVVPQSSKFFKNKEFFPIEIQFGGETIQIQKRPRKGVTDVIDIYSNKNHIGMFVGIQKSAKMLRFGPAGINKSHTYRDILNYTFVRLLEYYSLDNIDVIIVDPPENQDFTEYLMKLGFISKQKRFTVELMGEKIKNFVQKLEANSVEIKSQVGQIETLVALNVGSNKAAFVKQLSDKIIDKIKNMDPLGQKFWDNRHIVQMNTMLSTAQWYPDRIADKHEFLELSIKTIVTSFETYIRSAYLELIIAALQGKASFPIPHIQKMLDKMREIMPKETAHINHEELQEWIHKNMPAWKLSDKNKANARDNTIDNSRLRLEDFGQPMHAELRFSIQALIDHYNGENVFFGLSNRM